MIITLNQIEANTRKIIEVKEHAKPIYSIQMPATARVFSTTLHANGELVYRTQFQPLQDLKNLIPFKWLWSDKIGEACLVKDRDENIIGAMQHVRTEWLLSHYEVRTMAESLKIYEVTKKHTVHLLIFRENKQIGQIEKSLRRRNNLDHYKLFLVDEFARFKDLLILFVGYFDNWNYSDIGKFAAGKKEVVWEWTYSKANEKYDKKWLQNHFAISSEHKAAIANEQMGIGFKVLFILVGLAALSVIVYNFLV